MPVRCGSFLWSLPRSYGITPLLSLRARSYPGQGFYIPSVILNLVVVSFDCLFKLEGMKAKLKDVKGNVKHHAIISHLIPSVIENRSFDIQYSTQRCAMVENHESFSAWNPWYSAFNMEVSPLSGDELSALSLSRLFLKTARSVYESQCIDQERNLVRAADGSLK